MCRRIYTREGSPADSGNCQEARYLAAAFEITQKLIKKWEGTGLRRPSDLENDLNLKLGSEIAISTIGRKIVIETE